MKLSIAAGLFLNFCLLHYASSKLVSRLVAPGDKHRIAFSPISDRNWFGRSLFYVAQLPTEVHEVDDDHFDLYQDNGCRLVYMPDVLNRTGELAATACRCPADFDLVLQLPERQNLLGFFKFNGTEMRVTKLELPRCNREESSFALGKSLLEDMGLPLDSKMRLLDVATYREGDIHVYLHVTDAKSNKHLKTVLAYYDPKYKRYRGASLMYEKYFSTDVTGLSVLPVRPGYIMEHLYIETTNYFINMLFEEFWEDSMSALRRFPRRDHSFDFSLEDDRLGLCTAGRRWVNCAQHETVRGITTLKKDMVMVGSPWTIVDLSMLNLANNSGLLVALTLEEEELRRDRGIISIDDGSQKKDRRVLWIGPEGRFAGSLHVSKFGCDYEPAGTSRPRILDRGNGSYCLAMICQDEQAATKTGLTAVAERCFSLDEMSLDEQVFVESTFRHI